MSSSTEDYLKAIYELRQDGVEPTTGRIAERLSVAPASVTGMLKRMEGANPSLVTHRARAGVSLTDAGRRGALQTLRKHRLLEQFLVEILQYRWDEVHDEAERLEHAVSPQFVRRLSLLLGEPEFDPHGDPIPDANLDVPRSVLIPLCDVAQGGAGIVRRIRNEDPQLLRHLAAEGLLPGTSFTMVHSNDVAGYIRLSIGSREVTVGSGLGEVILVETVGRA